MSESRLVSQDEKKRKVAAMAVEYVDESMVLGVGTGSTVNFFLNELKARKIRPLGAVSSSSASSALLRAAGIEEIELNTAGDLALYIDGADEATREGALIKGGGGALTREKIVAGASKQFICMVDDSKMVTTLGAFPLPIEVIPMARSYVARQLVGLGGHPVWRENVVTDNGNQILDVHHLKIVDPVTLESTIGLIAGVVCVGLFARRGADVLLVGSAAGVEKIVR